MPQVSFSQRQDNLSYTPVWASSGTQPAIGNGILSGSYIEQGDLLICQIRMLIVSTTTFGTGIYTWSIPPGYTMLFPMHGVASVFDTSAGTVFGGIARLNSGTTIAIINTSNGAFWTSTAPITWADGDDMGVTVPVLISN